MANKNDYSEGLGALLGNPESRLLSQSKTPEEEIQEVYDSQMPDPAAGGGLDSIINQVQSQPVQDTKFDRITEGMASRQALAQEYGKLDELRYGPSPEQQIIDPDAVIGSHGERIERGLLAGWGDLVYGTGETIDFISAWAQPGDPEPTTPIGSWLKKVGEEYQRDNVLVLSEDLQDMTFGDLFKAEFWTSKMSKMLPYTLSFVVPYGMGANAGGFLLGRYGTKALKWANAANKTKKLGVIGQAGRFGQSGTGAIGKLAFDGGRRGFVPTKFARNWSGYLGGGIAANMAEGAYLSGEAYNQLLTERNPETGELLFSPDEAADIARGVMWDNGRWILLDVMQYGLIFGGMGKSLGKRLLFGQTPKKVPFSASARGFSSWAFNKVAPTVPAMAAYAGVEAVTEGFQETYQEWIKYANIQEGKGQDYDSITTWIRDADGIRPEIRDVFWSSVGLGGAMGGARGYFDAAAQRNKMYNEKVESVQNAANLQSDQQDPATIYENEKYMQDNLIAEELWNYYGDGSGLISYVNKQVKDGRMPQEVADEYITAIEEAEKSYEKHAVNTGLTEAGAKQAFFRETRLKRNATQQAEEKAAYDELVKKKSENITDDKKREKALEGDKNYHEAVMNILLEEEAKLKNELEIIYTRKRDDAPVAKSTGIQDKRYKVKGMTKEEFELYTQEGEKTREAREKEAAEKEAAKKEAEKPTIIERARDLGIKTVKGIASIPGKVVKGVKTVKDIIKDEKFLKEAMKDPKFKESLEKSLKAVLAVEKWSKDKITPSAKKRLMELIRGKEKDGDVISIDPEIALNIKGTGSGGIINNKDVEQAFKISQRKEKVKEEKEKADVKKKDKAEVIPKGWRRVGEDEVLPAGANVRMSTEKGYSIVELTSIGEKEGISEKLVVPKTEKYKETEKAIREKGAPLNLKGASISKGRGVNTYEIKDKSGKIIKYQDFEGTSDKLLEGKHDVQLRLKEPVAGQANVVEVNGKLYFQFRKGASLYDSITEVVVGGEVVGQLRYQEYKAPTKKAKKAKTKGSAKRVFQAIKESKENIQKLVNKSFDEAPDIESFGFNHNLEVYLDSGFGAYALLQNIMQKQFPGERGFVVSGKLVDDYGQESVALAIGSAVIINEESVRQTDLIHELGHIYYSMMQGTPLMKRINKLLYKTDLYQRTREDYPELTLMNYEGKNMTLGHIYRDILNKINNDKSVESDLKSIVLELRKAEKAKDSDRMNKLFNEGLRVQLKVRGIKEVRINLQKHLIEETFTRTLESYSYGNIDAIIKDSKTQEQLRRDLISFYKKTKKLATDEEAKRFLDLSVDNVANLDLEAAIKHVLLDFNSGERTIPVAQNSAYSEINKAKKKSRSKASTHSAIFTYVGDYIGRNQTDDQITDNVLKDIAKDSRLDIKDVDDLRDQIKTIIIQRTVPIRLKKADTELDKRLSAIGVKSKPGEDVTSLSEEPNELTKREQKDIALPTTVSNFIKKIVEVHNYENPVEMDKKVLLHNLYILAKSTMYNPHEFIGKVREQENPEIKSMLSLLDGIYKDPILTNTKLMELKAPLEGINIEVLTHGVMQIGKGGKRSWKKYKTISAALEGNTIISLKNNIQEKKDDYGKDITDVYDELFNRGNPNNEDRRKSAAEKIVNILLRDNPKGKSIEKQALLQNRILFKGNREFLYNILFDYTIERTYIDKRTKKLKKLKTPRPKLKNNFMTWSGGKFVHETKSYTSLGFFKKINKKTKKEEGQVELHAILTEGLVLSRAMNQLSMVDNVEQDGVSVMNKENGLTNRIKNIAKAIQDGEVIDKNDIMHRDNNIYSSKMYALKKQGKLADIEGVVFNNPLQITIHSGLMRTFIDTEEGMKDHKRAAKLNSLHPNELLANDFFMFLSRYNSGIKENKKTIIYDQPIAVFAEKSRRYYIESIAAHNQKMKNHILSKVRNNPAYKSKYQKTGEVFPFTIIQRNGNYSIKEMPTLIQKFSDYIKDNQELFLGNEDYKDINIKKETYDAYLTSYIANKFMAQQLFVHDHTQSENETDWTKRSAGAIASHINYDRNTMVEPVIIKDYYVGKDDKTIYTEEEAKEEFGDNWKKEVAAENDAMGYILPEQAEAIRAKYGEVQKVGNVFKFVYHYTEMNNPKLRGKTTYLKFAVHVLTPEIEASSSLKRNIGNVLRERHKRISEVVKPEFNREEDNIFSHGNLVIAASESAAKLFKDGIRGNEHIYDIRDVIELGTGTLETVFDPSIKAGRKSMDYIMDKQDELYMIGDKDSELRTYQGSSGEGLGIQLELDKETNERFFPTQLYYNLATNITSDEQITVNEMWSLRTKVMEANNKERNIDKGLIIKEGATQEQVLAERKSFESSVSSNIFGVLVDSMYGYTDPRHPYLNAVYNSIAVGRITHQGTKMYTKGSIAFQSSGLGMGLQSYKRVSDYFDENGRYKGKSETSKDKKFRYELEKLMFGIEDKDIAAKPNTLISEAIIPGYMKKKGVNIGDLFIGTRIPAHGKVSSAVFIVKDFHKQIGDSPTSNITIPAWVSKYWGADLDGDAVQMNFKFTDSEVAEKQWRGWSNEFMDKYIDLVSKDNKFSELTADIDFIKDAENAIAEKDKVLGKSEAPVLTVYQGIKGVKKNREFNYYTLNKEEAKAYGKVIEHQIDTTGFLDRPKTPALYNKLTNEFRDKTGLVFDILDSSTKGLTTQNKFFIFLKDKGYKGLNLITKKGIDNQYLVTFGKLEVSEESQLTPWGDAKVFEDNVSSEDLIGTIAALGGAFNIFSNNEEALPFSYVNKKRKRIYTGITIKGTDGKSVKRTQFFDDASLENGVGNWYGVAQLLNIALDNAKYGYINELGLDKQSVFPYVLLRRLGYSLNDLAVLFNSPIVKEYMQFKRNKSKNYISKDSDIDSLFIKEDTIRFNELVEFLKTQNYKSLVQGKKYNIGVWNKLKDRINAGINLDINKLVKKAKTEKQLKEKQTSEIDAVLMLYALDKFSQDIVTPFSKVFTVHNGIEKNPIELRGIVNDIQKIIDEEVIINKKEKGGLNIPYRMGDTISNPMVKHGMDLFNSVLNRASKTDIRFTPYMESILATEQARKLLNDFNHEHIKSKVYNRVVRNHLKQNMPLLYGARDRTTLLQEFDKLKKDNEGNFLLEKVLEVVDRADGRRLIVINDVEINQYTSYKKLDDIRKEFDKLNEDGQNFIFELDFEFNDFGLTGTSFSPFFSKNYMEKINSEIERIVEEDQDKKAKPDPVSGISEELERAIFEVQNPTDRSSLDREISESSRNNRTIIIVEPRKPNRTGRQVLNEVDTNRFKKYLITSKGSLPYEFFTESTIFKEFYSNELGRRQKAPESSTWVKNKDNLYDLIDKRTGEIYINNVNLRTGKQMHFDEKGPEGPIRKGKKVIGPDRSYNRDHLGDGVQELSFKQWNADKGINIEKIDKKSKIYTSLRYNYNSYLNDLKLAQEYISYITTKKPLSEFTIEELTKKAAEFRRMDNSATKGIAEMLEKEIGQRAFKIQSEFLIKAGIKQGYKYNIPGEDGVPQEDISNYRKWLGSNNMTSKRPEIQYLINEAEKEYTKYMKRFRFYQQIINQKNNALIRSKRKELSVLERIRRVFDFEEKYKTLYGNITKVENGKIRLLDSDEINVVWDTLSKEEQEYYSTYRAMVILFQRVQDKSGAAVMETRVPNMQMGEIEAMSRNGLFGLYNLNTDSSSYDKVKVYGKDIDGKRKLRTFYEWKYIVYKGRTKRISGALELNELDRLRRKAKALKDKGKHEDGTDILLSDIEYDALVNNGAALKRMVNRNVTSLKDVDIEIINEYERRKGVSIEKASHDLNTSLLEFVRGSLFKHGDVEVVDNGFAGMGNLAILTDSIIAFNKNLDNPNAVEYLTGWWKEGFLEGKKRVGIFGKTGDKIIDGFVRLTSLRFLGFSIPVALGNTLAGKYQELRKRGGAQFIKGEKRFWMHFIKSRQILKDHRLIQYSFDDFVHLDEKKGIVGKLVNLSYIFMEQTEHYIQGAAFLGMLTDQEFNSGKISDERVRYINHKIATLHGEGYTALDASLLSMYSYGRAILQFKKWFITLLGDRYSAEDINRFGEVNIGSYRPATSFASKKFRQFFRGELSMKDIVEEYKAMPKHKKQEMENVARGLGLTFLLLSLISILEDDDDSDRGEVKYLKRLQNDIFSTIDIERFVKYRIVPTSINTVQNTIQMLGEAATGEKVERSSVYAEKGTSKALKTFKYGVAPAAQTRKDIANIMYK